MTEADALDTIVAHAHRLRNEWHFDWPRSAGHAAAALRLALRSEPRPTLVAVVGGASSGKSTVFNNLVGGHPVSCVTAKGHATLGPIMAVCEQQRTAVEAWLADGLLLPDFPIVPGELADEISGKIDGLYVVYHPFESLQGVILFDLPDFTTEVSAHEGDITMALMPWFDRLLIVVDHERWFDRQSISQLRAASVQYGQARLALFNRTCEGALDESDRRTLQGQADRLGAEGMVVLEFRRGRGFCRFAPGTLDEALSFVCKPHPDRTAILRTRLAGSANDVLNQDDERRTRLRKLNTTSRQAAERALPEEYGCMTSLMIPAERRQLEIVSRVLRVHDARQWMSAVAGRVGAALRHVPGVNLALGRPGESAERNANDHTDRTAVALAFAETVARRQVHDVRRSVDNSDFWHEIRRWTNLAPRRIEFAWDDGLRSDVETLARSMDDAIAQWNERIEGECRGVTPNVQGAVGVGVVALAVVLIAVPGPVAALTLTSAAGAIGAALTKLAAASGAGALFGKHLGRLSSVLTEKMIGSPEFNAVRAAAAAFRERLAAHGHACAESAVAEARSLVMDPGEPLAKALTVARDTKGGDS